MLIVLDTNVLVSGLLNSFGPPGRILDLVLAGKLRLALDDRLLSEYTEVLARPRLGLRQELVGEVLRYILLSGVEVAASPLPQERASKAADPDDLPFAEVATAARAAAIVTGNARHFQAVVGTDLAVLYPAEFLQRWAQEQAGA